MPEMKYYIVYGNRKPEYQEQEAFTKAMEKWSKKVEEVGMKVVFWGASLGVPENALCVFKGTPENFMKVLSPDMPISNTRTNVVVTF